MTLHVDDPKKNLHPCMLVATASIPKERKHSSMQPHTHTCTWIGMSPPVALAMPSARLSAMVIAGRRYAKVCRVQG